MVRIVGLLDGSNGPLNGRLYVKAGGAFIGAPAKELVFKIENGAVDIELPPCPPSLPYVVDWRDIGDTRKLSYLERWRVPAVDELPLDEARGIAFKGQKKLRNINRGELIEATMLKGEVQKLQDKLVEREVEYQNVARRLKEAEGSIAAAQGQAAMLSAECTLLQQRASKHVATKVIEKEKIVERYIPDEMQRQQVAFYKEKIALLEMRNSELEASAGNAIATTTYFANLNKEIDRLKSEKQQLLARIEELKQPSRSTSALRAEAIANLDKLASI